MDDPEDVRPEDYVEIPATIPNPESVKPADWDSEDDGKWAPASIPNPNYTGEGWSPKRIPNPAYEGEWEVPTIANPEYVEGRALNYTHGAIGIDIWQVLSGTIFDNFLVTDDEEFAKAEAKRVWGDLKEREKEAFEAFSSKDAEKVSKLAKDASLAGDDEPVQDIRTGKEKDIAEDDLLDEIDEEAEEAAKVEEVKAKIEEVIEEVEDEVKEKEKDMDKAAEEEVKVVEEEVDVVEEKAEEVKEEIKEEVKEEIKEKTKVTKDNIKKVAEEITKAAEKVKAAKKKIAEKVIETTHDEL
jgi:calreticulin